MGTDSLAISEGAKLIFETDAKLRASAGYYNATQSQAGGQSSYYETVSPQHIGELSITHLDSINQVVSGTFWFSAVNNNGDSVKITEGRFDVHFTR